MENLLTPLDIAQNKPTIAIAFPTFRTGQRHIAIGPGQDLAKTV
jgi:hypothetical protein